MHEHCRGFVFLLHIFVSYCTWGYFENKLSFESSFVNSAVAFVMAFLIFITGLVLYEKLMFYAINYDAIRKYKRIVDIVKNGNFPFSQYPAFNPLRKTALSALHKNKVKMVEAMPIEIMISNSEDTAVRIFESTIDMLLNESKIISFPHEVLIDLMILKNAIRFYIDNKETWLFDLLDWEFFK